MIRGNGRQGSSSRGDVSKKIFIGGVPRSVADDEYNEYFRSFGEVEDCILMRDSEGVCRGFGFVTYREQSAYDAVFQAQLQLRGSKLDARKAVPMSQVSENKSGIKVFIGGLVPEVDKAKLCDFFSQYGEIDDAIVMMDSLSGNSRGFGFVTFANSSSVDELMKTPKFEFYGKMIECKHAQPSATLNRMRRTRGGDFGYGQRGNRGRGRSAWSPPGGYGGQFGGSDGFRQQRFAPYANTPQSQGYGAQYQNPKPAMWVERQGDSWGSGETNNLQPAVGYPQSNIGRGYGGGGSSAPY